MPPSSGRKESGAVSEANIIEGSRKRIRLDPTAVPTTPLASERIALDSHITDAEEVTQLGFKLLDVLFNAPDQRDGSLLAEPFMELPDRDEYPDYFAVIKRPVCFEDIEEKLEKRAYPTLAECKHDAEMVCKNAKRYNQRDSEIWLKARDMHSLIKEAYVDLVQHGRPSPSLAGPPSPSQALSALSASGELAKEIAERQRAAGTAGKPTLRSAGSDEDAEGEDDDDADADGEADPDAEGEGEEDAEGEVDEEYKAASKGVGARQRQQGKAAKAGLMNLPRGKRLMATLKHHLQDIMKLRSSDGRLVCEAFRDLPSKKEYPDYYHVIEKPISLAELWSKVETKTYANPHEFVTDLEVMIKNAKFYNVEGSEVYEDAEEIQRHLTNGVIPGILADGFTLDPEDMRKQALPLDRAAISTVRAQVEAAERIRAMRSESANAPTPASGSQQVGRTKAPGTTEAASPAPAPAEHEANGARPSGRPSRNATRQPPSAQPIPLTGLPNASGPSQAKAVPQKPSPQQQQHRQNSAASSPLPPGYQIGGQGSPTVFRNPGQPPHSMYPQQGQRPAYSLQQEFSQNATMAARIPTPSQRDLPPQMGYPSPQQQRQALPSPGYLPPQQQQMMMTPQRGREAGQDPRHQPSQYEMEMMMQGYARRNGNVPADASSPGSMARPSVASRTSIEAMSPPTAVLAGLPGTDSRAYFPGQLQQGMSQPSRAPQQIPSQRPQQLSPVHQYSPAMQSQAQRPNFTASLATPRSSIGAGAGGTPSLASGALPQGLAPPRTPMGPVSSGTAPVPGLQQAAGMAAALATPGAGPQARAAQELNRQPLAGMQLPRRIVDPDTAPVNPLRPFHVVKPDGSHTSLRREPVITSFVVRSEGGRRLRLSNEVTRQHVITISSDLEAVQLTLIADQGLLFKDTKLKQDAAKASGAATPVTGPEALPSPAGPSPSPQLNGHAKPSDSPAATAASPLPEAATTAGSPPASEIPGVPSKPKKVRAAIQLNGRVMGFKADSEAPSVLLPVPLGRPLPGDKAMEIPTEPAFVADGRKSWSLLVPLPPGASSLDIVLEPKGLSASAPEQWMEELEKLATSDVGETTAQLQAQQGSREGDSGMAPPQPLSSPQKAADSVAEARAKARQLVRMEERYRIHFFRS